MMLVVLVVRCSRQLYCLADATVEFVQGFCLCVAAGKSWDGGNVIAFFILLDDDVKIALHGNSSSKFYSTKRSK